MKSLSKMFGVITAGALMLAAPGCVVTDLADPAEAQYDEASWGDELFDDAADEAQQDGAEGDGSGDKDYDVLDEEPTDDPWPDPFDPTRGMRVGGE